MNVSPAIEITAIEGRSTVLLCSDQMEFDRLFIKETYKPYNEFRRIEYAISHASEIRLFLEMGARPSPLTAAPAPSSGYP
jgi:hypothetical protein